MRDEFDSPFNGLPSGLRFNAVPGESRGIVRAFISTMLTHSARVHESAFAAAFLILTLRAKPQYTAVLRYHSSQWPVFSALIGRCL